MESQSRLLQEADELGHGASVEAGLEHDPPALLELDDHLGIVASCRGLPDPHCYESVSCWRVVLHPPTPVTHRRVA
jgi:hypothetical protein